MVSSRAAHGDQPMSLDWIDTHAHLGDDRFHGDLPAVLERAAKAGLQRIIVVATTAIDSPRCVELAAKHPILRATVGMQPNHVAEATPTAWDEVVALAQRPEVVALGETGLDRYWDYTPFAQQEDYFARHLDLARKIDRAVVIHCRDAEADTVRMLRADYDRHGPVRAVMHSFTGDLATAQACLEMGLHISFAGMLTYKNAQNLRDVAAKMPLDRVLVETDCPYLAPVPHRGKRNEPAFVVNTAEVLAQTLGVSLDVIAQCTARNALTLFERN
ncbi:MAG: TatD family hydrolase [Planctomycetes bacterium]|nr:TatD family hydrolase [Planctomycetota bacterium]